MTKKEEFKQAYSQALAKGDVSLVILYIHMPDDSREILINERPQAKVDYVDKTYNDDLVHSNSDQIWITEYIFVNDSDDMSFGDALEILKDGGVVTRKGWNGQGQFLYYVPENEYAPCTEAAVREFKGDLVPYRPYIAIKTVQGDVVPWCASQTDLLAEDWVDLTPEEEQDSDAENGDSEQTA